MCTAMQCILMRIAKWPSTWCQVRKPKPTGTGSRRNHFRQTLPSLHSHIRPTTQEMPAETAGSEVDNSCVVDTKPVQCTLVLPRNRTNNSVLLARKARGFGVGKWMGFGGKVEPGETVDDAALRELREETGVALHQGQITKIGLLLFSFECKPGYFLEVHVYDTFALTAIPNLCDEFQGQGVWFTKEQVPYKDMWADFSYWSDSMFQGKRFRAQFWYGDFGTVVKSDIALIEAVDSKILAAEKWFLDANDFSWSAC